LRERDAEVGIVGNILPFCPVGHWCQLHHQLLWHVDYRLKLWTLLLDVVVLSFSFHLYELVVVGSLEKFTAAACLDALQCTLLFGIFDFCERCEWVPRVKRQHSAFCGAFLWTVN
jgi:hypothetical protein